MCVYLGVVSERLLRREEKVEGPFLLLGPEGDPVTVGTSRQPFQLHISCCRESMEAGLVGTVTPIKVWLFMLSRCSDFSGTTFAECLLGFHVFIIAVLLWGGGSNSKYLYFIPWISLWLILDMG